MNKFSLILEITNNYDQLEYCLKSIQEQTYEKSYFDVILIDNGSTIIDKGEKLQNLQLKIKNYGIKCKKTQILKKASSNIAFLYAGLLSKNPWLIYLNDQSFLFPNFLNRINTIINDYYYKHDVLLPKFVILSFITGIKAVNANNANTAYYESIYDPSIHRGYENRVIEQNNKLTDLFGLCINKSKIKLLPAPTDIEFFKNVVEFDLKVAYIDVIAGVLFTGERIDISKKQSLCDRLYYGASIEN